MPVNKKKSRPRDWHHEERQAKISYLYIKPKQEVCQMDDKELMIYLMKRCLELEKEAYKSNPDIDMERSKNNYHLIAPPYALASNTHHESAWPQDSSSKFPDDKSSH